jgi:hypothetical protein
MPAHDLPYFESACGQNSEASSVVKAVSLARSRETALPAAYRYGPAPPAGHHAPLGAPIAVAPGRLRAEGRDPPVTRFPAPGPPDVGMVRAAITCAVTAMAGSGRRPGAGRPTARDRPRPGRDLAGMTRPGLGPSGAPNV